MAATSVICNFTTQQARDNTPISYHSNSNHDLAPLDVIFVNSVEEAEQQGKRIDLQARLLRERASEAVEEAVLPCKDERRLTISITRFRELATKTFRPVTDLSRM